MSTFKIQNFTTQT